MESWIFKLGRILRVKLQVGRWTPAVVAGVLAGMLALVPAAIAQNSSPNMPPPPPPPPTAANAPNSTSAPGQPTAQQTPRVVRLSLVEGTVEILQNGKVQFSQAVMNMPLMEGTSLKTGADSRAEIEFDDGSVARLTPDSLIAITRLAGGPNGSLDSAVEQKSGLIYYELRSEPGVAFQVTFGDRTVTPEVNSTFRVNLGATPPAVAVLDGSVQVKSTSGGYFASVPQGQTMQFQPSASLPYTLQTWIAPNGYDDWNRQLDQEAAQEAQNQTPARVHQGGGSIMDSAGWSDLDNYGGWYPLPGYGMVWQPWGINAGFNPYGIGMWSYFDNFGYFWVSGYPWGWLPFNYGLWTYIGGFGWGWVPGPYRFGGYGYPGYGYGGYRWHNHHYPYTNVYNGPRGYHSPIPPARVSGHPPERIVRVGDWHQIRPGSSAGIERARLAHPGTSARPVSAKPVSPQPVKFRGTKIAPLRSTMTGVHVPVRNAALYNNYPARAFGGNIRMSMLDRARLRSGGGGAIRTENLRVAPTHSPALAPHPGSARVGTREAVRGSGSPALRNRDMLRPRFSASREEALHIARDRMVAERAPSMASRQDFGHRSEPGQRTSPMSRPGFGARTGFGAHRAFPARMGSTRPQGFGRSDGFHPSGISRGAVHPGGMRMGGFRGNSGHTGGFHGGAVQGGGMRSGGGFHGGGVQGGGARGGAMSMGGSHAGGAPVGHR